MASSAESDGGFAQSLTQLKRRGCNLLIVGSPAQSARRAVTERLLGNETIAPRQRLFVLTDAAHATPELISQVARHSPVSVVSQSAPTRSTAAASPDVPTLPDPRCVDTEKLGTLAWVVNDELDRLERDPTKRTAGELRVCFDSLAPLLATHDESEVTRFVRTVGNRVRSTTGMAHYHLPVSSDDPLVRRLADAFDAVIELRVTDGLPDHRWTLTNSGLESGWLPL